MKNIYRRIVKVIFDYIFALMLLPIFVFALIIFGPIIKITDGGPVFYLSYRLGKNGKKFIIFKFRSMRVNAPDIRLEDGSTYNARNDTRVTAIGRFLRATSIDELPQVLNILNGTMSLIGPRPDPVDWLERYPDKYKVLLSIKPGITGYNQAYFRNSTDGIEKMKNDAYYATHYTFILDFKIFFKTITMILSNRKTYKTNADDCVKGKNISKNSLNDFGNTK